MIVEARDKAAKCDGILHRNLGDDIIILSPDGQVLHTLAGSAAFIWNLIDGTRTAGDIASSLAESYEVTEGKALSDTLAFLLELANLGIIRIEK